MKNKKGFTLIELMVVFAIIFCLAGMMIPALQKAKQQVNQNKAKQKQVQQSNPNNIVQGDLVYIDGLDTTGRVTYIKDWGNNVDLLCKSTNGVITELKNIPVNLLTKLPKSAEKN